ncbi:hypothetical protein [Bdellovibrio sp. HCB337]|uniref:hypothetical protein n=1 Tax=Bdellovibrio sp. HCB337 TaxID=3394358 RepID=UPI0039A6F07F
MTPQRKFGAGLAGLLIALSFVLSSVASAEEVIAGSVFDESKESEVVQKARRRAYQGGRDEGDLAVQPQLTAPTRKMAPQVEGTDHSADD